MTINLTEIRRVREERRTRLNAITPGEWRYWEHFDVNYKGEHMHGVSFGGKNNTICNSPADSTFIANAPADLAAADETIERLCGEIEKIKAHAEETICDVAFLVSATRSGEALKDTTAEGMIARCRAFRAILAESEKGESDGNQ